METNKDLVTELVCRAESAKHMKFHFLRHWTEYTDTKKVRRAHKLLVESIRKSADRLFKQYCKSIITGDSDVINLVAYTTTKNVLSFYEEELLILDNMLEEYEAYLFSGNFIGSWLFFDYRPEDRLWDHRG